MRKTGAIFVAIVLVGSILSSSSLAERSAVLSESQLNQIEFFARNVYDWKGGFAMTVGDDWPWYRFARFEFYGKHNWQYVSFDVYPASVQCRDRVIGHKNMADTCEKIEEFIKKLLNRPAGHPSQLGRDLLK